MGSLWQRSKLTAALLASLVNDTEVDEAEIERLKQGDVLEDMFGDFARRSPALYRALIAERDAYMAARLREEAARTRPARVLAVVGAGHLEGLARELAGRSEAPAAITAPLELQPPPSRWGTWFGLALLVLVLAGFAWGFAQGFDVGVDVLWAWIATTAVLGAVGALLAGAHPYSIVGAAVSSPLTPLHPFLASGMVSGAIELWARKPRVGDFEALKDDVGTLAGWWRNRVARVFLVFFLTNLGTAIGVWVGGLRMFRELAG
jgi:pheromone shutdown-related protein TraB